MPMHLAANCLFLLLFLSGFVSAQVALSPGVGSGSAPMVAPPSVGMGLPASNVSDVSVDSLAADGGDASTLPGLNPPESGRHQRGDSEVNGACGQPAMAMIMDPLCAFYRRVLQAVSSGREQGRDFAGFISALHSDGHAIQYHQLTVMDLLVMDTQRVEFFLVEGGVLKSLGVAPAMVEGMPDARHLQQQLEDAMVTLPEGIDALPDTMALAVWGDSEPPLGSIMEHPLAVVLRPSALVLLGRSAD